MSAHQRVLVTTTGELTMEKYIGIVARLREQTPYGLSDGAILIDAASAIEELVAELRAARRGEDDCGCTECVRGRHGQVRIKDGIFLCLCCNQRVTVMVTDAPKAYDYGDYYSVPAGEFTTLQRTANLRTVVVPFDGGDYQYQRYASGMYVQAKYIRIGDVYGSFFADAVKAVVELALSDKDVLL